MQEKEKISLTKAVKGIVEPKNYVKAGVFSFNIGVVVVFIIGAISIYNMFFGKTSQTQSTGITVEKGASVESIVIENKQNEQKKTVGLEAALSSQDIETTFVKYFNDSLSAGIGIRYNFDADEDDDEFMPVVKMRWDFN